jgi:hypothetical protein
MDLNLSSTSADRVDMDLYPIESERWQSRFAEVKDETQKEVRRKKLDAIGTLLEGESRPSVPGYGLPTPMVFINRKIYGKDTAEPCEDSQPNLFMSDHR